MKHAPFVVSKVNTKRFDVLKLTPGAQPTYNVYASAPYEGHARKLVELLTVSDTC